MIEKIDGCSKELLQLLKTYRIEYYSTFVDKMRRTPNSPSLEEVRKYLRDNWKIDVTVDPSEKRGFLQWIGAFRYTNRTINNHFHEVDFTYNNDTYEEALDKTLILAIKYEKVITE